MKILKFFNYMFITCLMLFAVGCDKALDPYPAFETVPHGFGAYKAGTPTSLFYGNNDSKLEGTLQWKSTDSKNTVKEVDLYVSWTEGFLDKDGLPKTANHGKKKLTSIAQVPGARVDMPFAFTAKDVYAVVKDAKYDYQDGKGSHNVFVDPKDANRNATSFFTSNDKFVLSWSFKAEDGRVFDTWSGGICSNSVGANCFLNFNIVCISALAGTYNYKTVGWCGTEKSGTLELKTKGTGAYEPFLDGAAVVDFTFGAYEACYGVGGFEYPAGNVLLNDSCNKLFYSGADKWKETYSLNSVTVDGANLILDWTNSYVPEAGVTTITRTDGKPWPALRK